jgi:peptide/nickel transport system substrate-binding protein
VKKASVIALSVLMFLLVFSVGFSLTLVPLSQTFPQVPNAKYGGTLYLGTQAGPITQSMNPFTASTNSGFELATIYEPLFYVNSLNGDVTPLLGTSYKWSDNDLELTVTTRDNVKWSDGTPFTAQDVAFTFNYIKKYPALDTTGIWSSISNLQSVEASGTNVVVFKFSAPNVPLFSYIAGVPIVPEHIWSSIDNPVNYQDQNPVGTGPFIFESYSSALNSLTFVKNPNYWMQGRPFVDKVVAQSFIGGNVPNLLSMLKGQTQFSNMFIPDVQSAWIGKNPDTNKIYWPVVSVNALYFNTQKYPFNDVTFRKAVSLAIDKAALEQKAYFGTGGYDENQTGIIPSQQAAWLDPTLTSLASSVNSYNPQEAQKLLASIGFVKNSSGQLVGPDGNILPTYKILVGAGWTDFISMAEIVSSDLKQIGISTVVDQEAAATYMSSIMSGTYDLAISWGTGSGPTPYYYYYQEFSPAFSANKIGEMAASDWTRYTNPLITAALQVYAGTSDLALQKQAMYTIERIVLEDLPLVVLTNRTNFEDFYTKDFAGWPSMSNPYNAGENTNSQGGGIVLRNVYLK